MVVPYISVVDMPIHAPFCITLQKYYHTFDRLDWSELRKCLYWKLSVRFVIFSAGLCLHLFTLVVPGFISISFASNITLDIPK